MKITELSQLRLDMLEKIAGIIFWICLTYMLITTDINITIDVKSDEEVVEADAFTD